MIGIFHAKTEVFFVLPKSIYYYISYVKFQVNPVRKVGL